MRAFADTLHTLAFSALTSAASGDAAERSGGSIVTERSSNIKGRPESKSNAGVLPSASAAAFSSLTAPKVNDRRLLLVLSNVLHTRKVLLPALFHRFQSFFPSSMHAALAAKSKEVERLYETLDNLVFDQYVRSKTLALNAFFHRSFYQSGINWAETGAAPPIELRTGVIELLLQIVLIHNEISAVRKDEVENLLLDLIERLAWSGWEAVRTLLTQWTGYSAAHILAELTFIRKVLEYFVSESDDIEAAFDAMARLLRERLVNQKGAAEAARVDDIIQHIVQHKIEATRLMFVCFVPKPKAQQPTATGVVATKAVTVRKGRRADEDADDGEDADD
jgi:hypothetical protein